MKQLKINFDEIQKAMEDITRDSFDYFFDTDTGEVITFSEEILNEVKSRLYDGDPEDIDEDIEYIEFDEEPEIPDWMEDEVEMAMEILFDVDERYARIPERASSAAFKAMNEFIDKLEDNNLKDLLVASLEGKGAFRRFKDILLDYPKERKRWHGYNAKAAKKELVHWLHSIGVEPI
jgi:hypothetical protein